MFKTIDKNISAEIVEKKSKFIANLFYVESVEEAEEKIKELKKKYFDARHNCYAFSVYTKDGITNRFSDDGEPSGTAGSPMLNIINSKGITNILVVVTRYFGGILLGTGGLVRAYTGALQEALSKIEEVKMDIGLEIKLQVTYSDLEKLKYYLSQNDIEIISAEYGENVDVYINIIESKYNHLLEIKNELNFNIIENKFIKEKYIKIE
jgi:uncharacterized YigZ family protein